MGLRDGFKYEYLKSQIDMGVPVYNPEAIAVWIPMIVGLAPGLVYWFVITGMRSRK